MGTLEHVIPIPVTFKVNLMDGLGNGADTIVALPPGGGIPAAVLTIPRRNNGPIVADLGGGKVISVQYTGFSGTRELETFRLLNHASNLEEFKTALQYFDVGSQNFIYGDIEGNIGYFTTSEVPLREDLQASTVNGSPPWFIRNGQGGNEWLKDPAPTSSTAPATSRCRRRTAADRQPEERLRRERQQRHRPARRSTTIRSTSCGSAARASSSSATRSTSARAPAASRRRSTSASPRARSIAATWRPSRPT